MSRDGNNTVKIYTCESELRNPSKLVKEMYRDLLASRDLAWRLLIRDVSAQYRQAFLGFLWVFIPPIVTAAGLTLANNSRVLSIETVEMPYPAYVMFSMALWQIFTESLNGPLQALLNAKSIIAKVNFPREAIIIAQLGQVTLGFCIKLIFIAALFIWFRIPISWSILLVPVGLVQLVILGTFFGLWLAPIGILYQDIGKIMPFINATWLFITPVIFPMPKEGTFASLVQLNPVTPLLITVRELAIGHELTNVAGFWCSSGIATLGVIVTWLFYRLSMPYITERMSP